MTYRPTILNITTAAFLVGILVYTIWNYQTLSAEEGWGIVGMVGLGGVALLAGLIDLVLQQFIKNQKTLNVIGLIIAIGFTIFILRG